MSYPELEVTGEVLVVSLDNVGAEVVLEAVDGAGEEGGHLRGLGLETLHGLNVGLSVGNGKITPVQWLAWGVRYSGHFRETDHSRRTTGIQQKPKAVLRSVGAASMPLVSSNTERASDFKLKETILY